MLNYKHNKQKNMKKLKSTILAIVLLFVGMSCSKDEVGSKSDGSANFLKMKINNKEWTADAASVFGAYHPQGYNDATLIGGTIGQGASQQAFNINMYNTMGVGEYVFSNATEASKTDRKVAQLANLNAQDYLYGGLLGIYNMKVKITKASKSPSIVEGTFEGTLTGVRADVLTVTEGKFYYHE
jgi:hypothetical protein